MIDDLKVLYLVDSSADDNDMKVKRDTVYRFTSSDNSKPAVVGGTLCVVFYVWGEIAILNEKTNQTPSGTRTVKYCTWYTCTTVPVPGLLTNGQLNCAVARYDRTPRLNSFHSSTIEYR
jgi:hypothetical protein